MIARRLKRVFQIGKYTCIGMINRRSFRFWTSVQFRLTDFTRPNPCPGSKPLPPASSKSSCGTKDASTNTLLLPFYSLAMIPNPATLIAGRSKMDLPKVEQLGTISVEQLHQYHCNNSDRRCLSLFGKIYDVTSGVSSYGPEGVRMTDRMKFISISTRNKDTEREFFVTSTTTTLRLTQSLVISSGL